MLKTRELPGASFPGPPTRGCPDPRPEGRQLSGRTGYFTDLTAVDSDKTFIVQFNSQDDSTAKSYKVSLNPESSNYIENVLNTDPLQMDTKWHYLYAHFPVDTAVADVPDGSAVGVLTGDTTRHNEYGKFNTRYQAPKTTKFISSLKIM